MNDVVADIVADVVATTRRGSLIYSRNRFRAPWGAAFPAGQAASFHVVTSGACWLTADGTDPVQLTRGDVALIPSGAPHRLTDVPGRPARLITEIAGRSLADGPPECLVVDGDGPATVWLCGGYRLAPDLQHPLTGLLPPVVVVTAAQARGTGLGAAVDLLAAEVDGTDPGAPAVMASLVDLLFVYLLRAWLAGHHDDTGWGRALFDPVTGAALAVVHADPGRPWTLDSLARAAGAPRATFSRRFTALTGQSPMAYVTAWRMTVAARMLREETATLRQVAGRVGYESEFAFARAFKRTTGQAPGQYRQHARHPAVTVLGEAEALTATRGSSTQAGTRGCALDSAVHVEPEHAASVARPWPSVENRRRTPLTCGFRSWRQPRWTDCSAHARLVLTRGDTRRLAEPLAGKVSSSVYIRGAGNISIRRSGRSPPPRGLALAGPAAAGP